MPFVKLDTGILDSSLWSEPAQTCKCWVTLLAMMDATGLVRSTAPGIAKRAHLSLKHTVAALATFEAPDEHSRSLNDEGRRIKRIDGGYQVINSEKYRKYDYTAAERMKNLRERTKRGYSELMEQQGWKCDCCQNPFETPYSLYVVQDHDHESKENRGLVCQSCNKVIGLIERNKPYIGDKSDLVETYLQKWDRDRNGCNETVTLRKQKQKQKQNKDIGENGSRPTFDLENFLSDLEKDRTYAGINVREQYGKMLRWCEVNKKQPTQRRFVNWLNRTDRPMTGTYSTPKQRAPVYPKLSEHREPSQAELENARAIAKRETEALRLKLKTT